MIIIIKRLGELGDDPIKNAIRAITREEKMGGWNNTKRKKFKQSQEKGVLARHKGDLKHGTRTNLKKQTKKVCSGKSKRKV